MEKTEHPSLTEIEKQEIRVIEGLRRQEHRHDEAEEAEHAEEYRRN